MLIEEPERYHEVRQNLENQLDEQRALLPGSQGGAQQKIQRRIWVLKGVLCFDLDIQLLELVSRKYEKLGLVPQSYYMPEFFYDSQEEVKRANR